MYANVVCTKKTLQLISTFSLLVTAQHTTCSNTRLVLLEDGHNDARNMLRKYYNKHLTVASCWFSLSLHNKVYLFSIIYKLTFCDHMEGLMLVG